MKMKPMSFTRENGENRNSMDWGNFVPVKDMLMKDILKKVYLMETEESYLITGIIMKESLIKVFFQAQGG